MASVRRKARGVRASVWLAGRAAVVRRRVPSPVGGPDGLDLQKIVTATVLLLDQEGLGKLSMRRLAAELGVTAMSVYWYVDTKDELLELALDSVYADLDLPDEGGDDWAGQLRQLAHEHRRMLIAHPWVSRLAGDYLNVGPRAMAFVAAAQRAMRSSGLPDECLTGGLSLLFPFSYGFGAVGGRWAELCSDPGVSEEESYRELLVRLQEIPERPGPAGSALTGSAVSVQEMAERDFEFALECVLAGMASMRDRVGN